MLADTIITFLGIIGSMFIYRQGKSYITDSYQDINGCMERTQNKFPVNVKETYGLTDTQCSLFFLTGYTIAFMNERDICNLIGIKEDNVDVENTAMGLCKLRFDRNLFAQVFLSEVSDLNFHLINNPRMHSIIKHVKYPDMNIKLDSNSRVILNRFIQNLKDRVPDHQKVINWKTIPIERGKDLTALESIVKLIPSLYKSNKDVKRDQLLPILKKELDGKYGQQVKKLHDFKLGELKAHKGEMLVKIQSIPLPEDFDAVFREFFEGDLAEAVLEDAEKEMAEKQKRGDGPKNPFDSDEPCCLM